MTQQLHDELARIGDAAPRVAPSPDLAPDLWRRGRRARTRDRLVAAGAVLALVVGLGGLTTAIMGGPAELRPASPSSSDPGVPSTIHDVPDWLVQHPGNDTNEVDWAPELDVSTDLAVGTAAAVLAVGVDGGNLPMVVTADDGRYVPLHPPGYSDASGLNNFLGESSALALTEDGTRLAYAWWDPRAPLDAPMPAGVRVLDLVTGEIDQVALTGGNGIDVDELAFSPDGRYVAWLGMQTRSWTPMSRGGSTMVAGRIDLRDLSSRPVALPTNNNYPLAVSDGGVVALWNGRTVVLDDEGERTRVRVATTSPSAWTAPKFSGDGTLLALSAMDGDLPTLQLPSLRIGSAEVPTEGGELHSPLGWTRDGELVLGSVPADSRRLDALELVVDSGTSWGGVVGTLPASGVSSVEVATGLMTGADPTVERPAPDWPWSIERRATVGVLSGVGVVGVGMFLWTRRRRW
jgi:hypothetical protein